MSAPVATLSSLRQLLAERFPQATRTDSRVLATGIPAIDQRVGGVPCGALTEVVCAAPSCGSQLLLGELLRSTREAGGRVALVDAHNSFDPQSWPEDWLRHLVWVRGHDTAVALQAADILARDANFQLLVLDVRLASLAELRRTPASFWYRLQRAVEPSDLAMVVLTPKATVASAELRLQLERSHEFSAREEARPSLALALSPVLQRQRLTAASA
ncbi:MAG TPA: hypothetical protein VL069_02155 [Opitutus sp.]|nr:hypothetical protein [Opitutus sp.]